MKNNNKILYISIAILVLAVGILIGTYAYYQTTISGTISGNVAKWSFKANGQTSSFNLDLGDLYPGASGTYNIELSAEDSELDVYYEMYITCDDCYPFDNYIYWDSELSKEVLSYKGIYGTITAGSKIDIPLYFNWPYGDNIEDYIGSALFDVTVKAQQLTGYTGETPMYFYHDINEGTTYSNGYIYLPK